MLRDAHEARCKAAELLGPGAIVEKRERCGPDGLATAYFVGTVGPDAFNWTELGRGDTWGEALRAAVATKKGSRR